MDQYSKPPVQIVDEQVRKIDRFSRVSKNLLKIKKEALFNKYVNEPLNDFPSRAIYEKGKVYPVDEASLDSSFFLFRARLLEIIAQKDIIRFLPLVDKNIKADFGGEDGKPGFIKIWGLNSQEKINASALWPTLDGILRKGGTFSKNRQFFTAPYTYSNFPESGDMFSQSIIAGAGVRMRAEPNLKGAMLKKLSHDIVEFKALTSLEETIGGETHPWIHIATEDGMDGYVWGKFVVSPLGFRAGFEKQDSGDWKMVFLVAGD